MYQQWRSQGLEFGGGRVAKTQCSCRGVRGHAPPGKF